MWKELGIPTKRTLDNKKNRRFSIVSQRFSTFSSKLGVKLSSWTARGYQKPSEDWPNWPNVEYQTSDQSVKGKCRLGLGCLIGLTSVPFRGSCHILRRTSNYAAKPEKGNLADEIHSVLVICGCCVKESTSHLCRHL